MALEKTVSDYAKKVGELTISERKEMIDAKHILPITKQSELLSVSRSSFYYNPVENSDKQAIKGDT